MKKYFPILLVLSLMTTTVAVAGERLAKQVSEATKDPLTVAQAIPSWEKVTTEITSQLRSGKRDLVQWTAEVQDQEPKNIEEALTKIQLLIRTDLGHRAAAEVVRLKMLLPERKYKDLDHYFRDGLPVEQRIQTMLQGIYSNCNDPYARVWEAAMAVLETFPEYSINTSMLTADLHWREWDEGQILDWLASMQKRAAENVPPYVYQVDEHQLYDVTKIEPPCPNSCPYFSWYPGYYSDQLIRGITRPEIHWMKIRVGYLKHLDARKFELKDSVKKQLGHETETLKLLEQAARKNPTSLLAMLDYLNLHLFLTDNSYKHQEELTWIGDVFQPQSSTAASLLAEILYRFNHYATAEKLFRKAIDITVKPGESVINHHMLMGSKPLSPESAQDHYQVYLRKQVASCLRAQKKTQEAEAMERKANNLDKTKRCNPSVFIRGTAECEKHMENQEKSMLAQEAAAKNDVAYWVDRAWFYENEKKVPAEAERAYQEGLKLAKCVPGPPSHPKEGRGIRAGLICDYARLLEENQRTKEAYDLLFKEIQTAPASSESATCAARRIVSPTFRKYLDVDSPVLWMWLTERISCEKRGFVDNVECVLGRLAEEKWLSLDSDAHTPNATVVEGPAKTKADLRRQLLDRVEKHIETLSPIGNLRCGELLLSSQLGTPDPKAAIPWLRRALDHKDATQNMRFQAAGKLFEAYLAAGDVENAEKVLFDPSVTEYIISSDRQRDLTITAAKQGEKELAMRIWRRMANGSLSSSDHRRFTNSLRSLGLGEQIDAYYRDVQKKLSDFVCPR